MDKIDQLMPRAQSRALVLAGLAEWFKQRPTVELRFRVLTDAAVPEIWATLVMNGGQELNVFERMIEPTAAFIVIEKACQLYERKYETATPASSSPAFVPEVEPMPPVEP
jgi:hypothetical protein